MNTGPDDTIDPPAKGAEGAPKRRRGRPRLSDDLQPKRVTWDQLPEEMRSKYWHALLTLAKRFADQARERHPGHAAAQLTSIIAAAKEVPPVTDTLHMTLIELSTIFLDD